MRPGFQEANNEPCAVLRSQSTCAQLAETIPEFSGQNVGSRASRRIAASGPLSDHPVVRTSVDGLYIVCRRLGKLFSE